VLNGKSLGKKKNVEGKDRNRIRWNDVKYIPGYLEARAYKDGKVVARHRIETAGEAKKIVVEADNANWKAYGMDLQHVRVYAVDGKGRRVHSADTNLKFSVNGDAKVVAVDNGNIVSHELHAVNERKLFHGSAMVILRAGQNPSEIILTVEGEGFKTVKMKLQTK
jgi:beta-galactosidase